MRRFTTLIALIFAAAGLTAGELPADMAAKLVKVVVNGAGGKIACRDAAMVTALEASGVTMDPGAKVAWASSPAEAKVLKGMGKMVITGRPEMLSAGASVAIVEDGGRPKILLHRANLAASGVAISDAILKVGEAL